MEPEDREEKREPKPPASKPPSRVVRSDELLQGARELLIVHQGQTYRLLRTRKDKLILRK
jgi:hemin uptake protein HemP